MRSLCQWGCALVAAGIFMSTAPAQERIKVQAQNPIQVQAVERVQVILGADGQAVVIRPFGQGGGKFDLLQNKSVQDDLKLTEDQLAKIKELTDKQQQILKTPTKEPAERFKKLQELSQANEKAVADILKPAQAKRLAQISLQQQGDRVFTSPVVANTLKLTEQQKNLIRDIQQDSLKAERGLYQAGGDFRDIQKKLAEHRKATVEIILAVLTKDQKDAWKDLAGAPFKGELGFVGRGGFVVPQPPPPVRDFAPAFGPRLPLLTQKAVQEDLQLSEVQMQKIKQAVEKQREIFKDLPKDRVEASKKIAEFYKASDKTVADILQAGQSKRLDQIIMQQRGVQAFFDPKVAELLKLTDEQKENIRKLQAEAGKGLRELYKDAGRDLPKKLAEHQQKIVGKITEGLTPEQKARWKELIGEPFKGQLGFPRGLPGIGVDPKVIQIRRQQE